MFGAIFSSFSPNVPNRTFTLTPNSYLMYSGPDKYRVQKHNLLTAFKLRQMLMPNMEWGLWGR